jgi:hypothetical protein
MQENEAVNFFVEFSDHEAILLNIPHNNDEDKKQSNKQKLRRLSHTRNNVNSVLFLKTTTGCQYVQLDRS